MYIYMIKTDKDKDIKILYFDLETVTLESPENSCTFFQFSGMIEINGKEVERFNFFMNPDHSCEYNPESLEFNGITEDDLDKHESHLKVFPKFLELIQKYVDPFDKNDKMHTIGFNNIGFDNPKLWNWFAMMDDLKRQKIADDYELQIMKYSETGNPKDKPGRMAKVYNTFGSYFWTNPIDCFPLVSLVFIKYRSLFKNFKLQTIAEKLSQMGMLDEKYQKSDGWHNAMFDIDATRDIFHFCLDMFQMKLFDIAASIEDAEEKEDEKEL